MKWLFSIGIVFSLMAIVACNSSKNDNPNIIGHYECEFDGDEVNLSFYNDSTYVQTVQNKALGEMQFNGKFRWSNDTLYLIDEYYIYNGKTIASKDIAQDLQEEEQNRILKLINIDEKNLVLRDLRTQRVWEYHRKEK